MRPIGKKIRVREYAASRGWTLVGEADAVAAAAGDWGVLDEVDLAGAEARLKRIREVAGERRRYLEIQA